MNLQQVATAVCVLALLACAEDSASPQVRKPNLLSGVVLSESVTGTMAAVHEDAAVYYRLYLSSDGSETYYQRHERAVESLQLLIEEAAAQEHLVPPPLLQPAGDLEDIFDSAMPTGSEADELDMPMGRA